MGGYEAVKEGNCDGMWKNVPYRRIIFRKKGKFKMFKDKIRLFYYRSNTDAEQLTFKLDQNALKTNIKQKYVRII